MNGEQMDSLDEITTFNIKTRYNDYKRTFENICTKEFMEEKIILINEVRSWLKKMLEK